jgi:hypothetical protein
MYRISYAAARRLWNADVALYYASLRHSGLSALAAWRMISR